MYKRQLPLPASERLAATGPAAASADLEHHRQQEQRARAGRARLRDGDARHRLQHPRSLRRLSRGLHVEGPPGAGRGPLRLFGTGRGGERRARGARARREGRDVSAHESDRTRAVPQSAGLSLGRGQCPAAARGNAAAQLYQGPPRRRDALGERAGADRRRHPVLRHARPGLCAARRVLRLLRRHGQPAHDGPRRFHVARGDGRQPHPVRARGHAAAQGIQAAGARRCHRGVTRRMGGAPRSSRGAIPINGLSPRQHR